MQSIKRDNKVIDLQDRIKIAVESGRILARNGGNGTYKVLFVVPTGGKTHRLFDAAGLAENGYAQSFASFVVRGKPSAFVERVTRTLHDCRARQFDVRIKQLKTGGVQL
jgi:hypothetical protein